MSSPSDIQDIAKPPIKSAPSGSILPKPAVQMRDFADSLTTRKNIYDNVLSAAKAVQPVSNSRYTLELHDPHYESEDTYNTEDRKHAILHGETLDRRLKGTWKLKDLEGNLLGERKTTIAHVPHMTRQGTFVLSGSEYSLGNQPRLRPGIFTRQKENGEIESHINVMPGKGLSHHYFLDPETGIFKMKVGQAHLPLISVLRAMGAKDQEIHKAWGGDERASKLLADNHLKDSPQTIEKLYEKLIGKKGKAASYDEKQKAVGIALNNMHLDPEVTRRTLGVAYPTLSKEAALATTKKLLDVSRGDAETDDRDHLAYQHFMGPEDLIAERVGRDKRVLNELLWKATTKGSLDGIPTGVFTKHIRAAIMDSGVGAVGEEVNPLEMLDQQTKATRMGYGGITSEDSIPDESRSVNPSQLNYIDLTRTPESARVGVDARISYTAKKGSDGRIYSPFYDPKTKQTIYKSPQDITESTIAFPGELEKNEPLVAAQVGGRTKYVPREQVDLAMPHMEQAFSPITNLVPLKSALKGQRGAMASRFIIQALPLKDPEAPLVRNQVPGVPGRSFEEHYGHHAGAIRAKKQGGRVVKVEPTGITVKYADGTTEHHELYNNFPYNRKSVAGDTHIIIRRCNGEIWSGVIADYDFKTNDMIVSVDPVTRQSKWMIVTGYMQHANDKRLFRVSTKSGRHVIITEDHSLVEMGCDGKLVPVYPKDCVIGYTRLPIALIPDTCEISDLTYKPQFGYLAGLYLSEGCLTGQKGLVSIAVQPDDRAAEILAYLKTIISKPYRSGGSISFTDHIVKAWLKDTFGSYAHGKFIAGRVLTWPRRFREELIAGYMAGDGCLWADSHNAVQVTAVSVSSQLRDGLVDILASLGIFATKFDAPRNHLNSQWRDGYGFRIASGHLHKLAKWFFYADRENKFRSIVKNSYRASPFELVPIPKKARKLLYKGFNGKPIPQYIYKTSHYGAVAKHRLVGLGGPYGLWAASDVMWDVVDEIIEVDHQEWVYDIEVAGSETFAVNNGLIVHNTMIHNDPVVQAGDPIHPGQLLARSNYTDEKGAVALGKNFRTAYIPFGGKNYEDAYVISESAAKRMTSEHMYQHNLEWEDNHRRGRKQFVGIFPAAFSKKQLTSVDDDGIVKPGTILKNGDPMILAAKERELSKKQVHAAHKGSFSDDSLKWDHHSDGIVTDVAKTNKGVTVAVKAYNPMQVGDKMSGRMGDKGVVSYIVPDHQMPHDEQGRPYEVLANPLGVISRTNPNQMYEAALGKIAEKTGKPHIIEDFDSSRDLNEHVQGLLDQHGLKGTETITDPTSGRRVPNVFTGNRYFMKLHHMAESKAQGRGLGAYTAEGLPARGGFEGARSKKMALMDVNALLSHGALSTLRDAKLIRGQKNQEYWATYMGGDRPPTPPEPHVYTKFLNQLRGSGINVERKGTQTHIMPMTDQHATELTGGRELQSAETVDWKAGMTPVKGGLFDERLTGGHNGNRWSQITLHEPMPSPIMEEPMRRLLGLTQKKFEDVLAGKEQLNNQTGPSALRNALAGINVDRAVDQARADIASGKKTKRDEAYRRLGVLRMSQEKGIHPKDWFMSKVPVIPPAFRPVSVMQGTGGRLVSDANYLYKEVFDANNHLKNMSQVAEDVGDERLNLYNAFKGVTGLGDPIQPKNRERKVKGMLGQIFSSSPKFGSVQQKLIGTTVDLVGRAVVTPNPDLNMDQVGLPEPKAWEIYSPFIVRRLVRKGTPRLQALEYVKNQHDLARNALLEEIQERPVVITRAPVLHRYGAMAFYPQLTKGDTLQTSPIITKGFGLDFDGDTMNFHVPAGDDAAKETAEKMLPSKNLLGTHTFKAGIYAPSQEYQGGLYAATKHPDKDKRPRIFATRQDAINAYHHGELDPDHPIQIVNHK